MDSAVIAGVLLALVSAAGPEVRSDPLMDQVAPRGHEDAFRGWARHWIRPVLDNLVV